MFTVEDIGQRMPLTVFYDFDGTALAHGERLPSHATVQALGQLAAKDCEHIGVTGRDIDDAEPALWALGGRLAILTGGGDRVGINRDKQKISNVFGYEGFDDMEAVEIINWVEAWLDENATDSPNAITRVPSFSRRGMFYRHGQFLTTGDRHGNLNFISPSTLFVSYLSDESADRLTATINDPETVIPSIWLNKRPLATRVTSQDHQPEVQITTPLANKRESIKELAWWLPLVVPSLQGLQLKDEEILSESVFIGDGINDLPGFEAVGLKVAMGNAVPELKAAADLVIGSRRSGAFPRFIRKLASAPAIRSDTA